MGTYEGIKLDDDYDDAQTITTGKLTALLELAEAAKEVLQKSLLFHENYGQVVPHNLRPLAEALKKLEQ